MKQKLTALACLLLAFAFGLRAQVTTEPSPLQEDATDVVVFFHADQGSKGLAGLGPTQQIYAHTGVITSKSNSDSDWKYAPTWGENLEKYKLEYVSTNLWKLNIGNIRSYYGVPASETIQKLAFVFRNANSTKTGKATGDKDIFVDVLASGLQVALECDIDGEVVTPENSLVSFTLSSTEKADLSLIVNGKTIAEAKDSKFLEAEYQFVDNGGATYMVRGQAVGADGKKVYVARRFTYAQGSPTVPYPAAKIKMGPVENEDGSVTFCLAAPGKTGVYLLGSWNNFEVSEQSLMNRCEDADGFRYFWLTVPNLADGKDHLYHFLVDSKIKVGDPYARLVLDPSNDKYISPEIYPGLPEYPQNVSDVCLGVYRSGFNDYDWKVKSFRGADPDNLVIYELLLRDFTGTEGKSRGDGTVRQAIEKIPYLKSLGVNAVELLPINEFNGNISWGYNPNFYFAPDKAYGTPDDYRELIDELHANGIAVILDVVFNQSDWQHPWYKMYDVGSNPFFNASAPHAYSVLNDWNQGYPLVRRQWRDVVQYWLKEYHVDGFRFDLVKGLGDNDSYPNSGDAGTNDYNASRVANMEEIKKAMDSVNPRAYFINENLAGSKEENEMARLGMLNWANVNYAGGEYAKGNPAGANLNRFYAVLDSRLKGSTVSYLESHDEQRLAYMQNLNGQKGVKGDLAVSMHRLGSAAAQMILSPGSHMIWQFSEMGNDQSTKDASGGNNTDPKTVLWSYLDVPERAGLVEDYTNLIDIRLGNKTLFNDGKVAMACSASRWDNGRTIILQSKDGEEELYVAINPLIDRDLDIEVKFAQDDQEAYYLMAQSHNSTASFDAKGKTVHVPANCFAVVATTNVTGVDSPHAALTPSLAVRGLRGCLKVDSALGQVEVWTLAGRKVARLEPGESAELPAGLYIAVSQGESRKVVVR